MEDKEKSKKQLIKKIHFLNKIVIEQLEKVGVRHKKASKKLGASENKLYKVLETIQEGVTFSDETGYFYVYNSAMEKLTGYSIEEANAYPDFISLLYPDPKYRVMALQGIAELLEKKSSREIETIITTKNGQLKNVRISSSLISYNGSNLFLSVYRDITESKRTENRLSILNNAFLEFEADPDQNIFHLTAALGEIFGATCALYNRLEKGMLRAVGQWNTPVDFNPVDKPDGHICYDVIRRGENIAIIRNLQESPYAQTDPNVRRYQLKTYIGRAVKRGESYIGSLCSVFQKDFIPSEEDIKIFEIIASAIEIEEKRKQAKEALQEACVELKKMQTQLIQAGKLEAIGIMASGVAHEVRNPLAIILQGLNYLEDKFPPDRNDTREVIQIIKKNINRADNIIRLLFDFSRAAELDKKEEDVNTILENSLELVQHRIKLENIEVVRDLKEELPRVLVDKGRVEQVFINSLLNAIQAMPGGGRLFIRSYPTEFTILEKEMGIRSDYFEAGEELVIVEIEDTGVGIPQGNLNKLFTPFFTTKGPKGSGLGLSVSKNIIEMHRGIMEIKSEVGQGTKVIVGLKILKGK